jgi:hypothetical protein
MQLIKEINESIKYVIEEGKTPGEKNYFIEGVFLQAELKNRNGRVYPIGVMQKEVDRYTENYINKNRAYGELGHPSTPSINLDRVSHMIKSLTREGSNYIGKAKLLDTPFGKIAKSLIDEGANLGVSSRGLGTLKTLRDGTALVQDDFMLSSAADIVADPSGPDCFVNGIMENATWIYDVSSNSFRLAEEIKKEVKKLSNRELAVKQAKLFEKFLNNIK